MTETREAVTDPVKLAKLRQRLREELTEYAADLHEINELDSVVDGLRRDQWRDEERIRAAFRYAGLPLDDGPLWHQKAAEKLDAAEREALLLEVYSDLHRLVTDYVDTERDVIAALPFGASLDQLFTEKYGVSLP